MHKVDFTVEAEIDKPFTDVKVGQRLDLTQQEDGSWSCNREDGSVVCPVPAAAAGSIAHSQQDGAVATAVIRSVKRCQDNPEAAGSIQIRINFATQGVQAATATKSTAGTLSDCGQSRLLYVSVKPWFRHVVLVMTSACPSS
jgi:hypothetical protein